MSSSRVAGGHKANLNNPNTSEEAKEHSRQVLDDLDSSGSYEEQQDSSPRSGGDGMKNEGNVIRGHKANLKNPNTSEEAKQHSQQILEERDAL
ncbi:uncharacterized protein STEHIDRAFT_117550 [Stereum hirsutum FP-91666 SS1]|uniref:uncharacterized protein n=1 Tax=Stereum hirsutum (strain FP-91666) TaxID=721885 RepID=UPI00044103B0|nr:uncharacterized protein STEHIDRAFT_117550 [Stereum hirsutum FP-91666 SS1]EIM92543.1 hypothetical protein STEHIDRAFT_117550 [Stereum hirsutum FP-91666 SS1]